ncbi:MULTISPECIES: DUF554 domain-containing protein [unclassified Clostridium]|uniref:DUF554 domain-containing protein n=1 Tax=unclassified Clostridium TaxID=2614128 RepID=UPI0013F056FD|nr:MULTISPECIES: DUF554 domain-containing protein [unclassified Clostridium]NFG61098.1 DUF554 domain-containing protein [Clostridium botulinum]NFQ08844.1 DUF554 domain-containing protein [Clostridium botulinum]
MPIGIFLDSLAVLIGGVLGARFKHKIPHRINYPLTIIFGISAIVIGVVSFIKLKSLPAVILSLILGTLMGELMDLDTKVKNIFKKVIYKFHFEIEGDQEAYMNFYVIVAATFCLSGTNIFGAMNEAMTGDITILLSKAIMDIFAGAIFACILGYAMNLIVVPQFLILGAFFYLAKFIMPLINANMLGDFTAIGGILTFIIGLSIAEIKKIKVVNLLPALVIVFPISFLFQLMLENIF